MADKFNCNDCGKLTDTGYFYCETCHRMHKEKKQKEQDNNKCGNEVLNNFKPGLENLKKEAVHTDLEVKPS